jgi:hypothetical protein
MCDDEQGDDWSGRATADPTAGVDVRCEDEPADASRRIARREFTGLLVKTAAVATVAGAARVVPAGTPRADAAELPPVRSYDGRYPFANAMHIHSSFSEQHASLEAQLSEAAANNTSKRVIYPGSFVVWETEHDWREMAHAAPRHLAFTSLTKELVGGKPVVWKEKSDSAEVSAGGRLARSTYELVTDPVSPYDATPGRGALHLMSQGATAAQISVLAYGNFDAARLSQRTNLAGQSLSIDVLPVQADGVDTYLELRMAISYRPALAGRPYGQYMLSYRFGAGPGAHQTAQILGIVRKHVSPGAWQHMVLDPLADIGQLWPDIVEEDNSLQDLWLGATSINGRRAEGYFGNLSFVRTKTAVTDVLATQQRIKQQLAPKYPGVLLPRGREISFFDRHINAFGKGAEHPPDYSAYASAWSNSPGWAESSSYARTVQSYGGLVSFNHPFGTSQKAVSPVADQDASLHDVFADTHTYDICHADILEVGFQERGGSGIDGGTNVIADVDHHLALWDMHSRNSRWVTGTGVSDDHTGGVGQWVKGKNRFLTYPWALSTAEADLLAALSAGRAYVGELGTFVGLLDLLVDGDVAMGQVSIRAGLSHRSLKIIAAGLPTGSVVRVVQGPVDNPGAATTGPGTHVVDSLPSTAFAGGSTTVSLDTRASSFVRVEVVTSAGRKVAFTNPVYLLAGPSARPIPANRLANDSAGG